MGLMGLNLRLLFFYGRISLGQSISLFLSSYLIDRESLNLCLFFLQLFFKGSNCLLRRCQHSVFFLTVMEQGISFHV